VLPASIILPLQTLHIAPRRQHCSIPIVWPHTCFSTRTGLAFLELIIITFTVSRRLAKFIANSRRWFIRLTRQALRTPIKLIARLTKLISLLAVKYNKFSSLLISKFALFSALLLTILLLNNIFLINALNLTLIVIIKIINIDCSFFINQSFTRFKVIISFNFIFKYYRDFIFIDNIPLLKVVLSD
jgi:hypothetical protein